MRLLDRYLLHELLVPFVYCLSGFLIFWISFDLFNEMGDFQKQGLTAWDIAEYYIVKLPQFLVFPMIPVAWLLALLFALSNHTRHHEITAIRAAGVSLWRVAAPYFLVGGFLSAGTLAVNEMWVPRGLQIAEEILNAREEKRPANTDAEWIPGIGFNNARERRTWWIELYNDTTKTMLRPHINGRLSDGSRYEIYAERALWTNGAWMFRQVQELHYPAEAGALPVPSQHAERIFPGFSETPDDIERGHRIDQLDRLSESRRAQLSIREILDYQRVHSRDTPKMAMLATKLHGRLASPWICLVIVVIALPFAAAGGRRNVFVGVASSIIICFAYFVVAELSFAFGAAGKLPPWLAAWGPNFLFGTLGVVLIRRMR